MTDTERARLLALVEPRKIHMAVNVAQRREGGIVPACDGADCRVCAVIADELAALLPPVGQPKAVIGSWPDRCVQRAFVEGAKWWEWIAANATMWPVDRERAEAEAVRRYGAPVGQEALVATRSNVMDIYVEGVSVGLALGKDRS